MTLSRFTGFILCFVVFMSLTISTFSKEITVVPLPLEIQTINKKLWVPESEMALGLFLQHEDSIQLAIRQLKDEFAQKGNIQLTEGKGKTSRIQIGIPAQNTDFKERCKQAGMLRKDCGSQGYELISTPKNILLAAETYQGLFYGIQTLKQLIRGSSDISVPSVHIFDKPAFRYRATMDDISRGPIPTNEYMKDQIHRASELKINMLCYYTEHIFKSKLHPEFAPAEGGIDINEWKELINYAKDYYVEIIPNFQSLGHFEKILSHPKYANLGESAYMLSPVNPEAILFLKDIYNEMAPAFPSPFFHVNCDETYDLGRGPSKILADSIGVDGLYAGFMNKLHDILTDNNKQMMMWGDIVLQHPRVLEMLPKDAIMMTWEYGDYNSYSKWIDPFVKSGYDFFVCPGVVNSYRLFPDYEAALPNIKKFINEGSKNGAIGVMNTIWDDGGYHSFNCDWYGVAYGADHSWNPNDQDLSAFDTRFSLGIYGSKNTAIPNAIHELIKINDIPVSQKMNYLPFWSTVIPERGSRVRYTTNGWEEILEIANTADQLLSSNSPSHYKEDSRYFKFMIDRYIYLASSRLELMKASNEYAEATMIQFSDPEKTLQLLHSIKKLIAVNKAHIQRIKFEQETLWKAECRNYWLNFALDPYNTIIAEYEDLEKSFLQAYSYYEKGLSLPFPTDIRLDIREISGTYFTYWLMCGPFKTNENEETTDFLKGMGGEEKAFPTPGYSFQDSKNNTIRWRKFASPFNDRMDIGKLYENTQDGAVAYAFCTIESPDNREVTAIVGSNDYMEIICEGQNLYSNNKKRTFILDENTCRLSLKPGKNRILIKLINWKGNWDFSFRLQDEIVISSKNKYVIVESR